MRVSFDSQSSEVAQLNFGKDIVTIVSLEILGRNGPESREH